ATLSGPSLASLGVGGFLAALASFPTRPEDRRPPRPPKEPDRDHNLLLRPQRGTQGSSQPAPRDSRQLRIRRRVPPRRRRNRIGIQEPRNRIPGREECWQARTRRRTHQPHPRREARRTDRRPRIPSRPSRVPRARCGAVRVHNSRYRYRAGPAVGAQRPCDAPPLPSHPVHLGPGRRRMTNTQPFKDPAMNPLTPRKIAQLRRIAEDAADNHEKAVITPNDLNDLLDHASKDNACPPPRPAAAMSR